MSNIITTIEMSNIITTIDLRGSTTKKILVDDNFDYISLGWDINDVRGVVSVTGPKGAVYTNDDFYIPDIIPFISRRCATIINLPLDPKSGYTQVLKGNYTVRLVVKNINTGDTEEDIKTYSYQFTAPDISDTIIAGPYSGILKSTDTTDYQNPYSLTREHRIQYPVQLSPEKGDIVSTLAEVEVTPIYTNKWTVIITSEAEWRNSDELRILWDGTGVFTRCVYGGCITAMYESIRAMLTNYREAPGHNTGHQERYQKRLVIVNSAWHLLNIAYMAGDAEEADRQANIIQDQVEYSGAGICEGYTSEEVIPCPPYEPGEVVGGVDYTFTNGITRIGDIVKLGGTLTDNTDIKVSDKYLNIGDISGSNYSSVKTLIGSHETAVGDGIVEGNVKIEKDKVTLYYKNIGTPALSRGYEIASGGMVEISDYSSYYTDRSLISKSYFDANNNWGTQVIQRDNTLTGTGTAVSPLKVTNPFSGFSTLFNDYGYVEPVHSFAEIINKPTTLAGYGITDMIATSFLELTDTPSSYSGHANKFIKVNPEATGLEFSSSGTWVESTGGTFTGQVTFNVNSNYPVVLKRFGSGGSHGTPQAGINKLAFQDGDKDLQGEVGIDNEGNLILDTFISNKSVVIKRNTEISGSVNLSAGSMYKIDGVTILSAPPASGILDWDGTKYTPYSTNQANQLRFYTHATNPTGTDRLNIGAYFYATKLYDNNSRVVNLADNQTIAGIKTFNSSPIISANSAILSFSSGTGVKKITTGGTTDFAIMPGSGKVGIGKDDPGYELDVSGDIGASGDVIAFQGNDPGSSWWDSMPYATTANVGGFKVYSSQFEMDNGFLKIKSNIFEPYLSVPDDDDYILSSKKSGVRSWIPYAKTVLTDDILTWDSLNEKYTPYSTSQAASLKFYTHATNPTGTSRLNIGAYFYATRLYEGGTRVSVTGHTHSGADIASGNLNIACMPTGGNWDISSNLSIETNTFFVGYPGGTYDRMIGIGTNIPSGRVEINGGGQTVSAITDDGNRNSFLMLIHDSNTAGAGGALLFGNASSKAAGSVGWAAIKGMLADGSRNTRGHLVFCTRNATADTALTERMRLKDNGNLGIGTNNALQKLHVVGNIIATGDITAYYT